MKLWWVSKTCLIVISMIKQVSTEKLFCALGVTPHPVKVIMSASFRVGLSVPVSRFGKLDTTHVVRTPLLFAILASSCANRACVEPRKSEACADFFKTASAQLSLVA